MGKIVPKHYIEKIQEYYNVYYCKKCGCKISKQPAHPMQCVAAPVPFSVCYPLCEEHAKELITVDLSNGDTYEA